MPTDTEQESGQLAPEQPPTPERRTIRPREIVAIVVVLVIIGVLAAIVIPGPGKPKLPGNVNSQSSAQFAGLELTPRKPAPPLTLRNYLGDRVNLADYRGKAVLITFLYTHCPDVCPIIASSLHTAISRLGPSASQVRVVIVSVDPHGDTRAAVAQFMRLHELAGEAKYLIGSAAQLGAVWKEWNIGSQADADNPALVAHTALVYGISGHSGKLTTIYPANFTPSEIVHDLPKLVAS